MPIKFKRFPCRESNPGHGGENARSSTLDHIGILGYVDRNTVSLKEGWHATYFIAKITGEFNCRNILRWRGIEPRSPAWQARILPLNHQRYRSFIPTLQSFESDISVKERVWEKSPQFYICVMAKLNGELLGWTQYFQLDTDFKNQELRMVVVKKWKTIAGKN